MDSSSYFAPYTMLEYIDPAAMYGTGSHAPGHSPVPAVSCQAGLVYPQQYTPNEYYGNGYTTSHNDMAPREGNKCYVGAVFTKRRKIIIRQLQPWATESQIRELICHKAGLGPEKLQRLDMPLVDGQLGANRGYVIATLHSEEAAEKVIKRLNNYQFDGRVLEVRHTKEGVSDHQPSQGSCSNHQHQSHHSRRERHDDKGRKGKEKEKFHKATSTSPSQKENKSSPSESEVIIAHGSSLSYA